MNSIAKSEYMNRYKDKHFEYEVTRFIIYIGIYSPVLYNFNFSLQEKGDTNNQILYGLYAVMVHHGSSLYSGRYVSYVKI